MASAVSIANFALRRLGASAISDFGDPTTEATLVNDTFTEIRDSLLREHLWNFAIRRSSLAASATAPAWGFTRAFPIPVDFLRLVAVEGSDIEHVKIESQVGEGRVLLTDLDAPLYISYVARIEDAELMDPSFRRALSLRCALEWCQKLTGTNSLTEQIAAEYESALRMARTADGQEDTADELTPNFWVNARL